MVTLYDTTLYGNTTMVNTINTFHSKWKFLKVEFSFKLNVFISLLLSKYDIISLG